MHTSACLAASVAAIALAGCAGQQSALATPLPPSHPRIEGNAKDVSSSDVRIVLDLTRKQLIKWYRSALPIYSVRVVNRNEMEIHYWPRDAEMLAFADRVNGKWKIRDVEIERVIIKNANIPVG
jgi:hypothetical protein